MPVTALTITYAGAGNSSVVTLAVKGFIDFYTRTTPKPIINTRWLTNAAGAIIYLTLVD